jgi:hypothetical protein
MMLKIKKILCVTVIAVAFCALLTFAASADGSIYYCREALADMNNGDVLVYA